jgi:hypothetical protein
MTLFGSILDSDVSMAQSIYSPPKWVDVHRRPFSWDLKPRVPGFPNRMHPKEEQLAHKISRETMCLGISAAGRWFKVCSSYQGQRPIILRIPGLSLPSTEDQIITYQIWEVSDVGGWTRDDKWSGNHVSGNSREFCLYTNSLLKVVS